MTQNLLDERVRSTTAGLVGSWRNRIASLTFEFQPIVNVHSGVCYGLEAILPNVGSGGFTTLPDLLDVAARDGALGDVEMVLIALAIDQFNALRPSASMRLFCALDGRTLAGMEGLIDALRGLCGEKGLSVDQLSLEVSEVGVPGLQAKARRRCEELKAAGFSIVVDNSGGGRAGLQLVYEVSPRFLKIDNLFFRSTDSDLRRKSFVAGLISVAHQIGVTVIAGGVNTAEEFLACVEAGCDLAQGRFILPPTADAARLIDRYPQTADLLDGHRRRSGERAATLLDHLVKLPAVSASADLNEAVEEFRRNPDLVLLPVVNDGGEPVGVIRELSLKPLLFTQFGWHLMRNSHYKKRIGDLVDRCPIVDLQHPIEKLVTSYAADAGEEGLIVVQDMRYVGFLSSRALLRVIAEAELAAARDQSPLTRLPGNNMIYAFVSRALARPQEAVALVYFDFDHFKPFNDKLGFRQGDRAILLFADLMRSHLPSAGCFLGHVGGDDFFAAFYDDAFDDAATLVRSLLVKFEEGVRAFYDEESRAQGWLESVDRDGAPRRFPLMTVSAVMLTLAPGRAVATIDDVIAAIASAKKQAKHAQDHLAILDGVDLGSLKTFNEHKDSRAPESEAATR